jgi:PA14 domain/Concanavalin A-like lectin/glucanases superfamily/Bacterial Ig-like domain/Carboxypeptidase regulatory-like domain
MPLEKKDAAQSCDFTARRAERRRARGRNASVAAAAVLMLCALVVCGVTVAARGPSGVAQQQDVAPQTRAADERPKRTEVRPRASADLDLLGLAVTVGPPTQSVPKNTPTVVRTGVQTPSGFDPAQIISLLNPNLRVRGELTGPSLNAPLAVEARIGDAISIPPLARAGEHLLRNLRVVDTGQAGDPVVAIVTPDASGIVVIDRLLVSEVRVRELSYDEIVQAGINLTDDSYKAFNFTIGLATTSNAQSLTIPVAFPPVGAKDPRPIVGTPQMRAPGVDVPTVLPVMLTTGKNNASGNGAGGGGVSGGLGTDGGPVRIPGVVIIPGRVGFLNQFFEAVVIVSNGAPDGAPLVLHDMNATIHLPDNGTPDDASDDPLRIAETRDAGRVSKLDLHGLGADGKYGTDDDLLTFGPGQAGQASFLIEGRKEGLHTIDFDLKATLDGLPAGPLEVEGEVTGAVLVRDASFAVTFTHPSVVRAGQEYDLAMTLLNTGSRDIQGAFASLAAASISGAELVGEGRQQFQGTIKVKESATVKWRLRADVTGKVTASYVKVGDGISAGLNLTTGVGDRNVPLSPDSLVLPDQVRFLPPGVVEASRALLGEAWSIANAPPGSLPSGVAPVTKQTVVGRAAELGVAGLRVDFGEPVGVSLGTLLRDWLGELNADDGFADALRNTPAGYAWQDSLGAEAYKRLTGENAVAPEQLHKEFADAESARSPFISALVTQTDGPAIVGARFVNAQGERVGFGDSLQDRAGDSESCASLRLDAVSPLTGESTSTLGQMLVVSNADADAWTLELRAWQTGAVGVSLLVPATSKTYQQFVWAGVAVTQGESYRVVFTPFGVASPPALEVLRDGEWQASGATPAVTTLSQPAPRVVGVVQVTPDVLDGGDKYGRLLGVLFSKPMSQAGAETPSRYRVGGGVVKNSDPAEQLADAIKARGAHLDYGDRFVFLSLDSPVGPYVLRDLTISGVSDARRMSLLPAPSTVTVEPRVSPEGKPPGAYLTGRVLRADATPVANSPVVFYAQECPDFSAIAEMPPPPVPVAVRYTDAQGRYGFDYVRDGDCAPVIVAATNPQTLSEKRLSTPVAYDGQHMILDLVFLARGGVQGTVTSGGRLVPKVFVKVVPELDVSAAKIVQTDEAGRYEAKDIPVGNVSVIVVGADEFANASGLAAGTVYEPGRTTTIDVALQNIEGVVEGRVVKADLSAAPGALVVAYAKIPGFPTYSVNGNGLTSVGFAYADRDGQFRISSLPVGAVRLDAVDYVAGLDAGQEVQLSPDATKASGLLLVLPFGAPAAAGGGTVTGRVMDDTGKAIPGATVVAAARAVQADAQGNYEMKDLPAGPRDIVATDPRSGASGSVSVEVSLDETTAGADITILRPSNLEGNVYLSEEGAASPHPLAGAKVTADGLNIAETDAQGHYSLAGVRPNADLTLRFVDEGRQLVVNMPVRVRPGETQTKDATFRPATIRGRVFQPDGATGTVAQLSVHVPLPTLDPGVFFGLVDDQKAIPLESTPDGSYSLSGLNPGAYRVTADNDFFPTPVSKGGMLPPNSSEQCDLTLVDKLAGKIQGRVFQPDGTTPVGAGIRVTLGGGSLADATVRTDDAGHYEFAEVFPEGSYQLTASDTVTGSSNRVRISAQRNKDTIADIRLLGTGALRVRVVDGAGSPARTGSVELGGTGFPNERRFAEIGPDAGGLVSFDNLPEGEYAVAAMQQGLGGRAAATVPIGGVVEATVQLQSSGTVQGRVLLPGGAAAVGLADVELKIGGRSAGYTVTSDGDDSRGSFTFLNVPSGDFTLDVFDNRTGRVGRSAGRLIEQGEVATVNVVLLPVGAVAGRVTENGQPADHAVVEISADGSGLRGTSSMATTDPGGRFRFTGIPAGRFTVNVTDAPGGQTGSASGTLAGNTEPLPDASADIVLEPSVTIAGKVYESGGGRGAGGALVTATVGARKRSTTTREDGSYSLPFVPLGEVHVRAEAPVGFDRGEAAPVEATQPGSTVNADVTLAGVGTITGAALDNNGAPLSAGFVRFVNDAWEQPVVLRAQVGADGRFQIQDAPAGHFSLQLMVPNRAGAGAAVGDLAAGQTLDVPVRLEDAGRITAHVKTEDGTADVTGADVSLSLVRAGNQTLRLYTHTDAQGVLLFDYVPLGTASLFVNDAATGGAALSDALSLATNGQTIDLGELRLDATPIRVESVTPADGASGVTNSAPAITVNFSEAARASSVNAGSVMLVRGSSPVPASVSLSSDGRSATLTPTVRLTDSTGYQVVVTTGLQDLTSHALVGEFRSSFATADETAPSVTTVSPADGADRVGLNPDVAVTFDEPLARDQDLSRLVSLSQDSAGGAAVAGTVTLDDAARVATFRPAASLLEGVRYTVTVTGQRDTVGNVQTTAKTSSFVTLDQTPPVVDTLPIDGKRVRTFTPEITATYHDNASGVKTATVALTLDGADVTAAAVVTGADLSFRPATPLARGSHTVSLSVADNAGNRSAVRTASFEIDDSGPVITAFTVGGLPAAGDLYVTSSLRPVFSVTYTDDTGINAASTRLLLYKQGAQPAPVAASVTQTGLTYQPGENLDEGTYTVEAVITNNLGSSTTTGPVNFTLDADAPEIASVLPASGTQHGGTALKISGARLLSNEDNSTKTGTGLTAEYYDNIDFTGKKFIRIDPTVNFDFGYGAPDPSFDPDFFSIRWTGKVQPEFSETYTFYTLSDDGVRLWIDGNLVIDNYTNHGPTENSGTIALEAGRSYDIRLDYYEYNLTAVVKLSWSSPSVPKQIVPQARLTPAPFPPSVFVGGQPVPVISFSAGDTDELTVVTPPGAPGPVPIEIDTDRGTGVRKDVFSYQADPRTPFVSERDTILLWHLDEPGNGALTINDAGPSHSLYGTSGGNSTAQPGRFGGGRGTPALSSNADYRVFGFDHTSFTAECWVKTMPVGRAYTLVGKEDGDGSYYFGTEYALRLLPNGNLRAIVRDSSNRDWRVESSPSVYRVDDGQWHQLALVLDRAAGRLSIYIDGEERAFAATPPDFGPLLANGHPLRVGKWAAADENVSGGAYEFPGVVDEVRISSTAHTPEAIRADYLGAEGNLGVVITNNSTVDVARGTTTDIAVSGYNLAAVRASLSNPASPAETPARVLNSSATQANVRVTLGPDAPLGDARLILSSGAGSAGLPVRVIDLERVALSPEPDTRLLWHLDEGGGGAVRVSDASVFSIDGTSGGVSVAQAGRFGGGRALANLVSDTDFGSLSFGGGSFTVECWFKTGPVGRAYTLVGKEDGDGGSYFGTEYALRILPTGGMRAITRDSANREWRADMFPTVYDVDDGQWHHAAVVVDRAADRLSLYIDGVERAAAQRPAAFDTVLSNNQVLRVGKWAAADENVSGGGYEFPGVIDEVRVSSTAHTAERILNDVTGNAGLGVTSYNPKEVFRQKAGAQDYTNHVTVEGYNLDGATASLVRDGQPVAASINVEASSPRESRLSLSLPPDAPLGTAQLVLSKPGQPDASVNVRVGEQAELPGDSDTVLLWHLNEQGNGVARILDEGALSINGTSGANSTAQAGHFGGARAQANVVADTDYGSLSFGANSFTVECWVKTLPVGRAYTLVGKEDGDGGSYFGTEYALRLLPTGGLRAVTRDSANRDWIAVMGPTVYHVDDGQWHHVAMVVDREANNLSIVVDGSVRATVPKPAAFDTVLSNRQVLRVGKWAAADENVTGGAYEFPGVIDDVRVSSTAHSAERMRRDIDADTNVRVSASEPREVFLGRQGGDPFVNQIDVDGYHLDGVSARVVRDGQPLDAAVNVVSSSYRKAHITVALAPTTTPGPAQLVIAAAGRSEAAVDLRVSQQSELPADKDTVLVWHMNESDRGAAHVLDAGRLSINGNAGANSLPQAGHFAGGRAQANVVSEADYGALSFGGGSFTVECWFKTSPVGRAYTLVGKEDGDGGSYFGTEYALRLLPAGGLRAVVRDSANRDWRADMPGRIYDASQGRWKTILDNGQWHHVAMVVDRAADRLVLYADGVERASAQRPAAFDTVLSNRQVLRVGKWAAADENVSGGGYEFPGVIDDVRISSSAHSAAKVASDVFGVVPARVSYVQPTVVQAGTTSVPVVLNGYGLAGATVAVNRPDITASVVSTSATQISLLLNVPPTAGLGDFGFSVSDASGQTIPAAGAVLTVVNQQPFVNTADSNTDTPLLWHLDEAANGAVRVVGSGDAVPSVIGGQAGANSTAQPGRFGGSRASANINADGNSALSFGANSFTVECWVKTMPVGRAYTLVGKEDGDGGSYFGTEYALRLLPAGGLRAVVRDSANRDWKADMPGRVYDAAAGKWRTTLDDGQWHHVAMVVDRAAGLLTLYADGVARASSPPPTGFDTVLSNNQVLRVGKWAAADENVFGGGYEFPGSVDEVRVVNFAQTAAQIEFTWLGRNIVLAQ